MKKSKRTIRITIPSALMKRVIKAAKKEGEDDPFSFAALRMVAALDKSLPKKREIGFRL